MTTALLALGLAASSYVFLTRLWGVARDVYYDFGGREWYAYCAWALAAYAGIAAAFAWLLVR
jgi:hypothetical protein